MKIPISQIVVTERQRLDLGDIDSLADSIRKYGQIQPIYVKPLDDGRFELVAGMRRFTAISTKLCWSEIKATLSSEDHGEFPTLLQQEIELEEDVMRKDRSWQEKCLAMLKLHRIKKTNDPKWSLRLLAQCVGKSIGHVSEVLTTAEALEKAKPQTEEWMKALWKTETFAAAVQVLLDKNIREATAELERRRSLVRPAIGKPSEPTSSLRETVKGLLDKLNVTKPAPAATAGAMPVTPTEVKLYTDGIVQEAKTLLAFVNSGHSAYKLAEQCELLENGVICCEDWDTYNKFQDVILSLNCFKLSVPLIWNTGGSLVDDPFPFALTYRPCICFYRPDFAGLIPNHESAITAFVREENPYPISLIPFLLENLVEPDGIVYLPFAQGVVNVATCGYAPCFEGNAYPKAKSALIDYYQSIHRQLKLI